MSSIEGLQSQSSLPAEASSAGLARLIVRETLSKWGLAEIEEDASLLVSELMANVVLHAQGTCQLEIEYDGARLRVGLRDESSRVPVRRHRSRLAATGRGLALVEALATEWGCDSSEQGGKLVWFELQAPQPKTNL